MKKIQLFKVVGEDDEKTCPDCAAWQGKIVAGTDDGEHPTIEDFMKSKAFHPNCRCALRPIIEEDKKMKKEAKAKKKTLEEMAMNTANFEDEIVYRGFVKTGLEEDAYEFDDRWTMIAPLGEYIGTTTTGETVKEIFNAEDYEQIVFKFHEDGIELPLDRDHASMKKPLERDTQAYAWITDLRLMSGGADAYNGLYAKFRWTDEGKQLVLSRSYRFLSPVFTLDETGHPTALLNVALTNRPNFDLPPIFNTEATTENPISEEHNMDIEELKNSIIEGVMEKLNALNTAPEKKETACEEKTACEEEKDKEKEKENEKKTSVCEDVSETDTPDDDDKEKNDDDKEKEKEQEKDKEKEKEDDKEEKEESAKAEVITEEVMNTVPNTITPDVNTVKIDTEWRNLRGAELLEWARQHPYD